MMIFRLADRHTQKGPYSKETSGVFDYTGDRHPVPQNDDLGPFPPTHVFGFQSLDEPTIEALLKDHLS